MTSAMKKPARNLTLTIEPQMNQTLSGSTTHLEHSLHECCIGDIQERDNICNGSGNRDKVELDSRTQQRFQLPEPKPKSPPPHAMGGRRPKLQKKSHSDLTDYKEVHMKILVEGKEVLDTCIQGKYCPCGSLSASPQQETSSDGYQVMESLQLEQNDTKKPAKLFAGWFTKKTQSKSQCEKNVEPPIGFRSLRRSRSFSGRIKDKIKSITPSNSNHTTGSPEQQRSKYLQPPVLYKIIDLKDINREDHPFRMSYRRRYSDQTDAMLRKPLGAKQELKSSKYSALSLERGLKQRADSDKKLLERKHSNSLEKMFEFPFWSQITDEDRSRSCTARIRVRPSETHRDTNGMLETNLCSTEL